MMYVCIVNYLIASNIMDKEMIEYLGDGVYASFDGYHIWLAVNHHENKVVALDPYVMKSLIEYNNKLKNE